MNRSAGVHRHSLAPPIISGLVPNMLGMTGLVPFLHK